MLASTTRDVARNFNMAMGLWGFYLLRLGIVPSLQTTIMTSILAKNRKALEKHMRIYMNLLPYLQLCWFGGAALFSIGLGVSTLGALRISLWYPFEYQTWLAGQFNR